MKTKHGQTLTRWYPYAGRRVGGLDFDKFFEGSAKYNSLKNFEMIRVLDVLGRLGDMIRRFVGGFEDMCVREGCYRAEVNKPIRTKQ